MAIVGRGSAVADLGWIRLTGVLGWLAWLVLHIVKLIGFRNRLVVLIGWAAAYMSFQRSARLITNHPPATRTNVDGGI
jgi:NADH dehydrogenase